jgi:hypothetical protein
MKVRSKSRKILSLFVTLAMVAGLFTGLPMTVSADEPPAVPVEIVIFDMQKCDDFAGIGRAAASNGLTIGSRDYHPLFWFNVGGAAPTEAPESGAVWGNPPNRTFGVNAISGTSQGLMINLAELEKYPYNIKEGHSYRFEIAGTHTGSGTAQFRTENGISPQRTFGGNPIADGKFSINAVVTYETIKADITQASGARYGINLAQPADIRITTLRIVELCTTDCCEGEAFEGIVSVSSYGDEWYYTGVGWNGTGTPNPMLTTPLAIPSATFTTFATTMTDMSNAAWGHGKTPIAWESEAEAETAILNEISPTGQRYSDRIWYATMFKKTFDMPAGFNVDDIVNVSGSLHSSDGAVIFLNGVEIYRNFIHSSHNLATSVPGPADDPPNPASIKLGTPLTFNSTRGGDNTSHMPTEKKFTINDDFLLFENATRQTANTVWSRTALEEALKPGENIITVIHSRGQGSTGSGRAPVFFDLDFNIQFGGSLPGVMEWTVFPAGDDNVSFGGNGNHVMKLSNLTFDANDLPTRGASLVFNLHRAHDSGRRFLAWTDLSGTPTEITDITFATNENIAARNVRVSDVLGSNRLIVLNLPQSIIYDAATDTFASEIYVLLTINKGESGGSATDDDNYWQAAGNRGATARGGIGLAKEFDIIDTIELEVLEEIFFATNISLNPGVDETEKRFTWWTPMGEAEESVLQLVKASDLVGGLLWPSDEALVTEFKGAAPVPVLSPTAPATTLPANRSGYAFDTNRITVDKLELGVEYAYRVGDGDDDHWSRIFTFRTFDPNEKYQVILVGDPQLNPSGDRLLTNWRNTLRRAVERTDASGGAAFMISAGDQTGGGANDPAAITNFLNPVQLRSLPVMATVGNHDTQSQRTGANLQQNMSVFSTVYNWPNHDWLGGNPNHTNDFLRGGGNWYFSYGDTLYISLNTNLRETATHKAFMDEAVASHEDSVWRVITFHQDPFGNGTGHSRGLGTMRRDWSRFLDGYDIDIVINGHDHTHTRSYFISGSNSAVGFNIERDQMPTVYDADKTAIYKNPTGTFISPTGIPFFTLGAAADVPKYTSHVPWQEWVAYSDPASHDERTQYSVMTIDGDTLRIETYIIEGTTERLHDGITISKTAKLEDLQSLVPGMATIQRNGITQASWDAFQAELNKATALASPSSLPATPTSLEIDKAFKDLYDAYYKLDPATDKAALGQLVEIVADKLRTSSEGRWEGQYPIGSKAVLQAVWDAAFVVFDLKLSTQANIDQQRQLLQEAYNHFLSLVSNEPCPWIYVHEIPASGAYTISAVDWMEDEDPWYTEVALGLDMGGKLHYNTHFTKWPYSHSGEAALGGFAERTESLFGPATLPGGRGVNEVHITKTKIGEWIRYELDVAEAGAYKAQLGAANSTARVQTVVLRDMQQNVLTQFTIPANNPYATTTSLIDEKEVIVRDFKDAPLVTGDKEFYLPAGKVIIEMFIVACGTGATANSETPGNNYPDGPSIDILVLERTGNMNPPVVVSRPNVHNLPHNFTRIGGDAPHRQRAWAIDGNVCPIIGEPAYGLPVEAYNRTVKFVMEVAGRPGGPSGNHTTQIHIVNDGGGQWLPEYNPPVGVLWDPDIGPFGALVWDLENMPMPDGTSHAGIVHFPSLARTTSTGYINIAYYNNGWEELNYMRAYLMFDGDDDPYCTCPPCECKPCDPPCFCMTGICFSGCEVNEIKVDFSKEVGTDGRMPYAAAAGGPFLTPSGTDTAITLTPAGHLHVDVSAHTWSAVDILAPTSELEPGEYILEIEVSSTTATVFRLTGHAGNAPRLDTSENGTKATLSARIEVLANGDIRFGNSTISSDEHGPPRLRVSTDPRVNFTIESMVYKSGDGCVCVCPCDNPVCKAPNHCVCPPCECVPVDGCEDCGKDPCECPEDCTTHNWSSWTRIGTTNRESRTCSICGEVEERQRSSSNTSGGGPTGGTTDTTGTGTGILPPSVAVVTGAPITLPAGFAIPAATVEALRGAENLPATAIRATAAGTRTVTFTNEVAGQNAILVRVNATTGELEVVSAVTIGANGQATVNIPAAGDYLVLARKTGDITGTGEVETADALALLRHIAGIAPLNAVELFVSNGEIGDSGTNDALNILRYIAGIIDKI